MRFEGAKEEDRICGRAGRDTARDAGAALLSRVVDVGLKATDKHKTQRP